MTPSCSTSSACCTTAQGRCPARPSDAELSNAGKKLIVLSNTSRRKHDALKKLGKLGFDADALTDFICSGEEAWQHVSKAYTGRRLLWLAWEDDYLGFDNAGYLDGLKVSLASAEKADAILAQGTQIIKGGGVVGTDVFATGSVSEGDELSNTLRTCRERGVTMLCCNPDFQATQPDGSIGYMPGTVARHYESTGGSVTHFGKPYGAAFAACLAQLDGIPKERICHVGDSLDHDVVGANAAGIDSLFVTSGIHAPELPHADEGDEALAEAAIALCLSKGAQPTHIIREFVW